VDALQYVEDPHVLHVFFFHVAQSFQDLRLTSAAGKEANRDTGPSKRAIPR